MNFSKKPSQCKSVELAPLSLQIIKLKIHPIDIFLFFALFTMPTLGSYTYNLLKADWNIIGFWRFMIYPIFLTYRDILAFEISLVVVIKILLLLFYIRCRLLGINLIQLITTEQMHCIKSILIIALISMIIFPFLISIMIFCIVIASVSITQGTLLTNIFYGDTEYLIKLIN